MTRSRREPMRNLKYGPYWRTQRSICWCMRARSNCSALPTRGSPRGAGSSSISRSRADVAVMAVPLGVDIADLLASVLRFGRDLLPHEASVLALPVALLLGLALVVLGLALGERDL